MNNPVFNIKKIGVIDQYSDGWTAGESYTKTLLHSLSRVCYLENIDLSLITENINSKYNIEKIHLNRINTTGFTHLPLEKIIRKIGGIPAKDRMFVGEGIIRRRFHIPDKANPIYIAKDNDIQVVLPVKNVNFSLNGVKSIGWLPDFQHTQLPEMFAESDRIHRDGAFHRILRYADLVLVSSQSSYEHCRKFDSHRLNKVRVAPFPSLFAFEPPNVTDGKVTLERFNIPTKFALVANQMWRHKNHSVVIQAVGILKRMGLSISVVMTGMPVDNRDPHNSTLSSNLQTIAENGLQNQIIILGKVTYTDLINLLRNASVVIQPSHFEGWNTSVQDAKALGRPLLCSDISIHREQAPSSLDFFDCKDPSHLAEILHRCWRDLEPGVDVDAENNALVIEKEFALNHGYNLLSVCQEAYAS